MSQSWSSLSRRSATALFAVLTLSVVSAAMTSAQQAARPGGSQNHASSASHNRATHALSPAQRAHVAAQYGQMPLQFEQNQGQAPGAVRFLSMHGAYEVALTSDQLIVNLNGHGASPESVDGLLSMQLANANPHPILTGEQKLPGKVNYFLGNKREQWHTGVSTFAKVRAREVYPGVDLVYYGNNKELEYDFVLKPGIDPKKVGLNFTGARSLHLEGNGDLLLHAKTGEMRWKRPEVYQMIGGKRHSIEAHYTVRSPRKGQSRVGFEIARYDHTRPLVIDPTLVVKYYDTLNGGNKIRSAGINSMVADASGNVYAAATSFVTSATYAKATSIGGSATTASRAFTRMPGTFTASSQMITAIKLDATGAIVYVDIFGTNTTPRARSYADVANAITIDAAGNAYVLGSAFSPDLVTTANAFQNYMVFSGFMNESASAQNAYVAKLDPSGSVLYASYFGGDGVEQGNSIAVTSEGNTIYIGGTTSTTHFFPGTGGQGSSISLNSNGFQTTYGGHLSDCYLARLDDSSGNGTAYNGLAYCTLMGSNGPDQLTQVIIDPSNTTIVYCVGYTSVDGSNDPQDFFHGLANGFQTTFSGSEDGFLVKVDTGKSGTKSFLYGTYLGGSTGSGSTVLNSEAVVSSGVLYLGGATDTTDLPVTSNALQSTSSGSGDAILLKVDTTVLGANGKLYASYLGGSGNDAITAMTFDGTSVYVTGSTTSTDLPTTADALQTGNPGGQETFLARFTETDPSTHAQSMASSSYVGSGNGDFGAGIGVDGSGAIYLMGNVQIQGNASLYFAKLKYNNPPFAFGDILQIAKNTPIAITLDATDDDGDPLTYTITLAPFHGTLSGTAPNLIYTPDAGFRGDDIFDFKVNDGYADSHTAPIDIKVVGKPTANAQSVSVAHNTANPITLTGSDPDVLSIYLTYAITANPTHGTLSGFNASTGAVTYTPNNGYQGTDSFTFTVNNGTLTSDPATVTLNVAAGVPTANTQAVSTPQNTAKQITLTGADPNLPALPLTYTVTAFPNHGALIGNASNLTYIPNNGYIGFDIIRFKVNNGYVDSNIGTVFVTVAGKPTANPQNVSVAHNTPTPFTLTGSDPDSPALALTYTVTANPTHGTLSGTAPNLTYTPNNGYYGGDTLQFTVTNGIVTSDPATITFNVAAGAPSAFSQTVVVNYNTPKSIALVATDPNIPAQSPTYVLLTNPTHGTLSGFNLNTGVVTYTPNSGYSGPDSFQFKAHNNGYDSNTATVSITVNPPLLDVSGQISVTPGPFTYNRVTGAYTQVLTLTNTGSTSITGPISVILNSLANATLANASGTTGTLTPLGRPYINALVATLPAGASTTVTLSFNKTGTGSITYATVVVAGTGTR